MATKATNKPSIADLANEFIEKVTAGYSLEDIIDIAKDNAWRDEAIIEAVYDNASRNDQPDILAKMAEMLSMYGNYVVVKHETQKQETELTEFCEANGLKIIE